MVSIIEVTTRAQLRQFVDYPNILYKDVPQFVPATFDDDMSDWNKKKKLYDFDKRTYGDLEGKPLK